MIFNSAFISPTLRILAGLIVALHIVTLRNSCVIKLAFKDCLLRLSLHFLYNRVPKTDFL